MSVQFDYKNQAWVENGVYVRCGHPESMECGCFGRAHAGELVNHQQDSDCDIEADRHAGANFFRGVLVALGIEAAICVAVYFILHAWRLL